MAKVFDFSEVAKHNTPESCWVILYGNVYDVTSFVPNHPGGSKIIYQLAGTDATEEYDPIHPRGTLEDSLPPEAKLGTVDPATLPAANASAQPASKAAEDADAPVNLEDLLNMDDIEQEGTKRISHKAWAYYYSASDDLLSKSFNTAVYRQILLRPRMFVDISKCNMETTLLGHKVGLPIYVSPAAMARLAHPDGEHGMAQACAAFGAAQVISHNASQSPEEIVANAPADQLFGWQLYVQNERHKSEKMLARINKLPSIKFIVLTLDAPVPGKREHDERSKNIPNTPAPKITPTKTGTNQSSNPDTGLDEGSAAVAADPDAAAAARGGVGRALFWGTAADLTWRDTIPWLRKHTHLPIVLKGLQTHEDAYLASRHPEIKGIILSNHGGRALDTAPPAVHTLLEIRKYCPDVFDRIDVWVDGGVRRGTDVVKALCLGAKGVGIGRPPLFGLGAGGTKGVERVLEILKAETETCMRLLGVTKVEDLGPQYINTRVVERDIYDGPSGLGQTGLWDPAVKAKL